MRERLKTYAEAFKAWAKANPMALRMLLLVLLVQPLSECAHAADPKAGRVFDAVAPVVVTQIVDAVEDGATSSTGAVVLEPLTIIGAGGAGGQ